MLNIVCELFDNLNEKIRYVHFKSNQHLNEGLKGKTDLDLLVHKDDYEVMKTILIKLNFIKALSPREQTYPFVEHWFGFDAETGKMAHIHLHCALITGKTYLKEYKTNWEDIAFASSGFFYDNAANVRTVSPEFEIILLMTRIVCKASVKQKVIYGYNIDGYLTRDFMTEFIFLKDRIRKKEFLDLFKECYENSTQEQREKIYSLIESFEGMNEIYKIFRRLAKVQFNLPVVSEFCNHIKSVQYKCTRFIKKYIKKHYNNYSLFTGKTLPYKGKVISVIGCDGTGKSTITKEITEWLAWKFEVKKVYLGSGNGYFSLYKFLKKILMKNAGKNIQTREKLSQIKRKNGIVRILEDLQYYKASMRSERLLKKIDKYTRKGAIVVTDRYPQMQFDGIYDGPKVRNKNSLLGKLERKNFEKMQKFNPDLVIKLLLPYDEIVRRRPDDTRSDLERKVFITEHLKFENSKTVDIDAQMPLDQELIMIKKYVWKELTQSN